MIKSATEKITNEGYIIGYLEAIKTGKKVFIADNTIEITSKEPDEVLSRPVGLLGIFMPKEKTKFKLYREKNCIEDLIRPSIAGSMNEAFNHAVETMQVTAEEKLAFKTVKAINIVVCGGAITVLAKSVYKKKQEDVTYVDKVQISREIKYSANEMKNAFKKHLSDVYENVKTIQEFPNAKMELLLLEPAEEELMTMLKRQWKAIPGPQIHTLDKIQQKITAYKELE